MRSPRRPAIGAVLVFGWVLALTGCEGPAHGGGDPGASVPDTTVPAGEDDALARDTAVPAEPETSGSTRATAPATEPVDSTGPSAGVDEPPLTGFDTVFAYFTDAHEAQVAAPRPVPGSLDGLRAAFTELLEGPTPAEREAGLRSWFSRETAGMLRGVTYEDGFAIVDFEDLRPVIPNAVGSAGALMLMGELQATAFQFPAVERVEFRINGDCEALMGWLQFGCYPIRRGTWDPPSGFRTAVR